MVPKSSQTISLSFSHVDPTVVQTVLSQMITNYFKKEREIHLAPGEFDSFFNDRRDKLAGEIATMTDREAELINQNGVVDPSRTMQAYQEEEAIILKQNDEEQADLAEGMVVAARLKSLIPAASQTNATAPPSNSLVPPSEETIAAYRTVSQHLKDLQDKETRLEGSYTSKNPLVQTNQAEIQEAQAQKHRLEQETPALLAVALTETEKVPGNNPAKDAVIVYNDAIAKIGRLQARMLVQSNLLQNLRTKGTNLTLMLGTLRDIDRDRTVGRGRAPEDRTEPEQQPIPECSGGHRASRSSRIPLRRCRTRTRPTK